MSTVLAAPGQSGSTIGHIATVEQFIAEVGEDHGTRRELVDGAVLVSPAPSSRHQRVVMRLARILEDAVPDTLFVHMGVNVKLAGSRLLIPDLLLSPVDATFVFVDAADVVLAIEVISPGSRLIDRRLKHEMYAEAGIRGYLLVDVDRTPSTATLFQLTDEGYALAAQSIDGVITLVEPVAVTITLGPLLSARPGRP